MPDPQKDILESQLSTLEIWASEQGKVLVELKADLSIVKDNLPDMKEIKKLLREI